MILVLAGLPYAFYMYGLCQIYICIRWIKNVQLAEVLIRERAFLVKRALHFTPTGHRRKYAASSFFYQQQWRTVTASNDLSLVTDFSKILDKFSSITLGMIACLNVPPMLWLYNAYFEEKEVVLLKTNFSLHYRSDETMCTTSTTGMYRYYRLTNPRSNVKFRAQAPWLLCRAITVITKHGDSMRIKLKTAQNFRFYTKGNRPPGGSRPLVNPSEVLKFNNW